MKILLIAWFNPKGINAVLDHINAIKKLSRHRIDIFNSYKLNDRMYYKFRLRFKKQLNSYDAILFHNTATYSIEALRNLNSFFNPLLSDFKGKKLMLKQDEMRRVNEVRSIIRDWNIQGIGSCLIDGEFEKVYGNDNIRKFETFTGYVAERFKRFKPKNLSQRSIDVAYRGMPTPFEWGRLGYEKYEVAVKFPELGKPYDLKMDISYKLEDRLNGEEWIQLLNNSRCALAVESGASIFDFDGSIEKTCNEYREKHPKKTFEEVSKEYLHQFEGKIKYNQISPRHIEAAYTRTAQILYEGEYSHLITPGEDYIVLKKDYSNFDEVVSKIKDDAYLKYITDNCYKKLIENENLSYKNFVKRLDQFIESI